MGLILAAVNSVAGTISEQWKDYFYCESIPANVLAVKGSKKVSGLSSNRADDNIITNGSGIAVADGQCMIIVEKGKVVDVCAEPGEYTYDMGTEPSLFGGDLAQNLKEVFAKVGKRFAYGGENPTDQRIYYFNTKELTGNKYGTPNPIPFRVVDEKAAIDLDISLKCFGEYSFRIVDPMLFYTNVCANISDVYYRDTLEGQMKSELLSALQPAFARLSEQGIRYSYIPAHTTDLCAYLKSELSALWSEGRGIEITNIAISSIKADERDEETIKEMQRGAAFMDPTRAAANLVAAQTTAMKDAANNANGAANGFIGVNMAQGAGSAAAGLYAQGQAQAPAQTANGWTCSCGAVNTGNFCTNCGTAKPAEAFCPTCGKSVAADAKFCPNCGAQLK